MVLFHSESDPLMGGGHSESESAHIGGGPIDSQSEPEQSLMGGPLGLGPCWAAAVELATETTETTSASESTSDPLIGGGPMGSQSEPEQSLMGGPCFLGGPIGLGPCWAAATELATEATSQSEPEHIGGGPMGSQSEPEQLMGGPCFLGGFCWAAVVGLAAFLGGFCWAVEAG